MNIFFTDKSPVLCAQALDNRRLNKMMLETVQLFGYAMANLGIDASFYPTKNDNTPYKVTGSHRKHPSTVWVQQSRGNFEWLLEHLRAMCEEYEYRYGTSCAYSRHIAHIEKAGHLWPSGEVTEFANCSMYKSEDTIMSYRRTMVSKWETAKSTGNKRRSVSFGRRGEPEWYGFLKNSADQAERNEHV